MVHTTTSIKTEHPGLFRRRVLWRDLALFIFLILLAFHAGTTMERARNCDAGSLENVSAKSEYELALRESLGFFDDITTDQWKMIKSISKARVHHLKKFRDLDKFFAQNWDPDFSCQFEDSIGQTEADGHKWVCDPHRLRNKADCLIYSIGCNGQFEFEVDMQRVAPDCDIHIFDPADYSQNMTDNGLNGNTNYHAWGLTKTSATWGGQEFKTLTETMEVLGHSGRRVDVFKIDCEGCEWQIYPEFEDHDLRQILIEVHGSVEPQFFESMANASYVIFHKEPNLYTDGRYFEFAYLKLAKEFFQ